MRNTNYLFLGALLLGVFLLNINSFAQTAHISENVEANDPAKKTFFNFSEKNIVNEDKTWDVAFSKTNIFINGTYIMLEKKFEEVKSLPENPQFISAANGKNPTVRDWYEYDPASHLVQPIADKTYLIKTTNGQLIKMKILSYYQNRPEFPEPGKDKSGYFTFEFVVSKDGKNFVSGK
jgi:hypothetical protein